MIFSEAQLKSDEAIELKRKDLSKAIPKVPITSDQYLFEISEIKANLTAQLTDAVKESAFDCYIYSNGKCVNFGDPRNDKFSYVPNYSEQQNDTTVKANKVAINKARRQKLRIEAINYYGGKCACCGEAEMNFLCIDHIGGGGNAHRKIISTKSIGEWLYANKYPLGFQVLCHNCNMAEGIYGICPHNL
jgi:hypothetical protein